jgi:predicted O-linked N-acetylglucosamine transferase (SPINDLY family)
VAAFFEPLLHGHDRRIVEVFCYAEVGQADLVTERMRAQSDHWCSTVGMSDADVARKIEEDSIDILVDLAGHTANNRLLVFAAKPAPLQVTWLGYPNTTGLAAIDYRLVDAITDPKGKADGWASEALLRLKDGFLCYAPAADTPNPAPVPSARRGFVTFGSFNNPAKLSDPTLDAWAALLNRAPTSRLLLKGHHFFDDMAARSLFAARLADRGVAPERLTLLGLQPDPAVHLALYGEIDIALDPFPYNGTTTTCEALWMGVPVVTLQGDRHASRVGASLLRGLGLGELVAADVSDYVAIGAGLAGDSVRLADLRASLRTRMRASALCDRIAFARKIEAAYRQIWRRWCDGQTATPFDVA